MKPLFYRLLRCRHTAPVYYFLDPSGPLRCKRWLHLNNRHREQFEQGQWPWP